MLDVFYGKGGRGAGVVTTEKLNTIQWTRAGGGWALVIVHNKISDRA